MGCSMQMLRVLPLVVTLVCVAGLVCAEPPTVRIAATRDRIGMGRTVVVTAEGRSADGAPAAGYLLLPYVNGARWGSHEYADAQGRARFLLPLPTPGIHEIVVEVREAAGQGGMEEWIWASETRDEQTLFLQGACTLDEVPERADLWVAVDDMADVSLNGEAIASIGGWQMSAPVVIPAARLRTGENTISVRAANDKGPAGLLVRLEDEGGRPLAVSGPHWRAYSTEPPEWPNATSEPGEGVRPLGRPENTIWAMPDWPSLCALEDLIVGKRLPPGANTSNAVQVRVDWRELQAIREDPEHLVGVQWEAWFTPHNANWSTAQAVPVVGRFWSWNRDVTRQHMIWLIESGANFLVVDWTNHLWDREHWNERGAHTNEIIHATQLALETLATLRDEGHYVPRVVLYPGLNNGPATTMGAVNEEAEWIYHTFVRNPRFSGLFQEYLGKPLLLIHNGGGPNALEGQEPVNDEHFTIRWQSSQSDSNRLHERGYWSWMDGSLDPMLTRHEGRPEALTVSTAFFGPGGWKADGACGRRNGWTYVESFKAALRHRPRFIELHQFNEFAGQPEGSGYGPDRDIYGDSYSVELSDDIEPVSLTAPGYRGDGGWGFLYLNLTRALVDLYRQETPETTVVAVGHPLRNQVVTEDDLRVVWTSAGAPAEGFTVALNDREVARGLRGTEASIDLTPFPDGPIRLVLTAEGTTCRYVPSYTEDSLPLEKPVPAFAEVEFLLRRGGGQR